MPLAAGISTVVKQRY